MVGDESGATLTTAAPTLKEDTMAKPKLGSGERFRALRSSIARRGGVRNPSAVAAAIGRRKFGAKRFAQLAAQGRRRRSRNPAVNRSRRHASSS